MFYYKKINIKYIYFIFVIFLLSFFIVISFNSFKCNKYSIILNVKKWDNILTIRNKLCKKDIIKKCLFAYLYFRFYWPKNIIPGIYEFSWNNIDDIFNQLKKWAKLKYIKFTIIPWQTKFDIANNIKILEKKYNINQNLGKTFISLVTNKKFIKQIQQKYTFIWKFWKIISLEWFLYPDTYFFKLQDLQSKLFPKLLINTAIKNFVKKNKWISYKNNYKLSYYNILILASILEKEEPNKKTKPLVANILIRRFINWRMLWADWTLCYWLNIISSKCKNYLYWKYLKQKNNLYNTRTNTWLPPTPVSNPTIDTIKSIINSKKNDYRYYLHDKNWKIYFSKTNRQHNIKRMLYLKN